MKKKEERITPMKSYAKIVAMCLVVVMLIVSTVACGVDENDLVGTYKQEWEYQGNSFEGVIVLLSSGTYTKTTYKNGNLYKTVTGDWDVDGRDVYLYDSDSYTYHGNATVYTYFNGKLKSGDSVYEKQ